jgi:hypothetical protein
MRFVALLLISVIFLGLGLLDAEAKTTKFQETIRCEPNTDCSSTFTVTKGAKATLTISVATSDRIEFKVEKPNGGNVRLSSGAFPDTQGMTQVFTRIMFADVTGDYTLYFLDPIPKNFRVTLQVVIEYNTSSNTQSTNPTAQPNFEGGCLIATATYGSELAPQVQMLREIRDNSLLATNSGTSFMNSFNEFYYSFSPYIADYERENHAFREAVKVAITPMISSLAILNYVDMDSDAEVLGYGISLILLNVGMYVGIPAIVIMRFKKLLILPFKKKDH